MRGLNLVRRLCVLVALMMLSSAILTAGASRGASVNFSYAPIKPEVGETITVAETVTDPGVIEKISITVYLQDKHGVAIYPPVFQDELLLNMSYSQLANGDCIISYSFTTSSVGKHYLDVRLLPQMSVTSHAIDVYPVGEGHTAPINGQPQPAEDDGSNATKLVTIIIIIAIVAAMAVFAVTKKRGTSPSSKSKQQSREKRMGKKR
jgi:multisubunit Na+/H+ antiporter MnhC subunit